MDITKYRHILVVDLEATCCDANRIPRHQMETIEIGAVMATVDKFEIVAEFQTFIKPQRHPILTDFCRQLTSISQQQVDTAPSFPAAIESWQSWLLEFDGAIFSSWVITTASNSSKMPNTTGSICLTQCRATISTSKSNLAARADSTNATAWLARCA